MTLEMELDLIKGKALMVIKDCIRKCGEKSEFTGYPCVKLPQELIDKLSDLYEPIVEVHNDVFLDEDGLQYNYSVLTERQLAIIADHLKETLCKD